MRKAIFIIGVPGTGKTTLTRQIMKRLASKAEGYGTSDQVPLIPFNHYRLPDESWKVLGKFSENPTTYAEGTDKMSMGCQPHFNNWIDLQSANLLIEGDRLANMKSVKALQKADYEISAFVLTADDATLNARYEERGSNQNPTFLKGRATKVKNLALDMAKAGIEVHHCVNTDKVYQREVLRRVLQTMFA